MSFILPSRVPLSPISFLYYTWLCI